MNEPQASQTTKIRNPSLALQKTPEGERYLNKIRKMGPYDRFLYWIKERHNIFCQCFPRGVVEFDPVDCTVTLKESERPWTSDPVLQSVFFCNPYKENDNVTAYLHQEFRNDHKDKECVFLGTILLRLFNYNPTMRLLLDEGIPQQMVVGRKGITALNKAYRLLIPLRDQGTQMFGGAYIFKFENGVRKVESGLSIMERMISDTRLYDTICKSSMSEVQEILTSFRVGNFYVYQFIGDLAYTHVFNNASDWWTFSFCGPGTSRGLNRVNGISGKADGSAFERRIAIPKNWHRDAVQLMERVNADLITTSHQKALKSSKKGGPHTEIRPLHMRNITGCLCEFDKYERALNNERTLKRGYPGYA